MYSSKTKGVRRELELSHKGKRFKGNMICLLDNHKEWGGRKFEGKLKLKDTDNELLSEWGLVIRNDGFLTPKTNHKLKGLEFKNLKFVLALTEIRKYLEVRKLEKKFIDEMFSAFNTVWIYDLGGKDLEIFIKEPLNTQKSQA